MLHGIIGLMNSGKTALLTKLLFLDFLKGRQIISNYNLNFSHFIINKDFLIKLGYEPKILKNISFGFDELWIWLDARNKDVLNKISTYFFLQTSKDDTNIYYTAQTIEQVEKRLRENTHKLTTCSRVIYEDNKYKHFNSEQRYLPNEINKKLFIECIHKKRKNFLNYSDFVYDYTEYLKIDRIFTLYNTSEKITYKDNLIKT